MRKLFRVAWWSLLILLIGGTVVFNAYGKQSQSLLRQDFPIYLKETFFSQPSTSIGSKIKHNQSNYSYFKHFLVDDQITIGSKKEMTATYEYSLGDYKYSCNLSLNRYKDEISHLDKERKSDNSSVKLVFGSAFIYTFFFMEVLSNGNDFMPYKCEIDGGMMWHEVIPGEKFTNSKTQRPCRYYKTRTNHGPIAKKTSSQFSSEQGSACRNQFGEWGKTELPTDNPVEFKK